MMTRRATVQQWRARKDALVEEMKALNGESAGREMRPDEVRVFERLRDRARALCHLIEAAEATGEADA